MGGCEICTRAEKKSKIQEALLLAKTNLSYMENYICKINSDTIGTGFFLN